MKTLYTYIWCLIIGVLLIPAESGAQPPSTDRDARTYQVQASENSSGTDSTKKARVEIINTDVFEFTTTDSNQVRQFNGAVHFRHEGTDFFCDRAVQFMDTEIVIASGNVHIQKPDSFDIWSNYLVYYSKIEVAKFRGNVVFQDSTSRLLTDSLDFNLDTDIGYFWGGGRLESDSSILMSENGTYYHRLEEAIFRDSVHLSNPEFDLYADSMRYDSREKVAYFIAPTKIVNDRDVIYTNSGYFDTKTNKAQFGGETELTSGSNKITADLLVYDQNAGYGEATGNVIWEDTVEQITILANYSEYTDSLDYVMATDDPLLIDINDEDTLYLSADTLITFRLPVYTRKLVPRADTTVVDTIPETFSAQLLDTVRSMEHSDSNTTLTYPDSLFNGIGMWDSLSIAGPVDTLWLPTGDSIRIFHAYRNTKVLNGRMSGVCDSLHFSEGDSIFRMHGAPLSWVDTTQFSGDSIHMVLKNGTLNRIHIYRNSFIIHESTPGIYDQTKGKLVTGFFKEDNLQRMEVTGNGESIYFIQDDSSAYVGGNKTICSKMIIYMKDSVNEVDYITFLTKPEAVFTPFSMIDLTSYNLANFGWFIDRKPLSVYDVVRYLPLYNYFLIRNGAEPVFIQQKAKPPGEYSAVTDSLATEATIVPSPSREKPAEGERSDFQDEDHEIPGFIPENFTPTVPPPKEPGNESQRQKPSKKKESGQDQ